MSGSVLALNGTYVACSYIFKSAIQDERQRPSGLSGPAAAECGISQRTWRGTGLVTKVCSTDITCHRPQTSGQYHENEDKDAEDQNEKTLSESLTHLNEEFESFRKGILKVENYLFTFLTDPHVPYDNNASERGARKIKIKQEVSGCLWTDGGADDLAKLHSIAETAMKNGNSKFDAILVVVKQLGNYSCTGVLSSYDILFL